MLKDPVTRVPYKPTYEERMPFFDMLISVSCTFDPLNGRSSLGNVRCLGVLFLSFVNVIRFLIVKRHSFLMR